MSEESSKEQTAAEPKPSPKGELKMCALLLVISGALFVDSLKVDGIFQGVSNGPGSIPQLVSGLLVLMVISVAVSLLVKGYKEGSFKELAHYLFNKEVLILLAAIILYGWLVEILHFIPTTILFLILTMYVFDRKQFVKKLIISVGTVAVLVLIFKTLFQVILP
ncbi:MAG: tripartite tricarboxylate transporter TctB family protein [Desulfitobacterium hafniense]|nr:tripartite tricarboxylate transporter TctB family protein [Desulfitobacterium hafniense]